MQDRTYHGYKKEGLPCRVAVLRQKPKDLDNGKIAYSRSGTILDLVCFNNPSENIGVGHHKVFLPVEFQFCSRKILIKNHVAH